MSKLRRLGIVLVTLTWVALFATPFGLYFAYRRWESDHYRQVIAPEMAVAEAVFIGTESHFREGCGVVVFRLAPSIVAAIRSKGAAAFDGHTGPFIGSWMPTPYEETGDGLTELDSWQLGFDCADMDTAMAVRLRDALRLPGAYVKRLHEAALIVMPKEGLVALVYYG